MLSQSTKSVPNPFSGRPATKTTTTTTTTTRKSKSRRKNTTSSSSSSVVSQQQQSPIAEGSQPPSRRRQRSSSVLTAAAAKAFAKHQQHQREKQRQKQQHRHRRLEDYSDHSSVSSSADQESVSTQSITQSSIDPSVDNQASERSNHHHHNDDDDDTIITTRRMYCNKSMIRRLPAATSLHNDLRPTRSRAHSVEGGAAAGAASPMRKQPRRSSLDYAPMTTTTTASLTQVNGTTVLRTATSKSAHEPTVSANLHPKQARRLSTGDQPQGLKKKKRIKKKQQRRGKLLRMEADEVHSLPPPPLSQQQQPYSPQQQEEEDEPEFDVSPSTSPSSSTSPPVSVIVVNHRDNEDDDQTAVEDMTETMGAEEEETYITEAVVTEEDITETAAIEETSAVVEASVPKKSKKKTTTKKKKKTTTTSKSSSASLPSSSPQKKKKKKISRRSSTGHNTVVSTLSASTASVSLFSSHPSPTSPTRRLSLDSRLTRQTPQPLLEPLKSILKQTAKVNSTTNEDMDGSVADQSRASKSPRRKTKKRVSRKKSVRFALNENFELRTSVRKYPPALADPESTAAVRRLWWSSQELDGMVEETETIIQRYHKEHPEVMAAISILFRCYKKTQDAEDALPWEVCFQVLQSCRDDIRGLESDLTVHGDMLSQRHELLVLKAAFDYDEEQIDDEELRRISLQSSRPSRAVAFALGALDAAAVGRGKA